MNNDTIKSTNITITTSIKEIFLNFLNIIPNKDVKIVAIHITEEKINNITLIKTNSSLYAMATLKGKTIIVKDNDTFGK